MQQSQGISLRVRKDYSIKQRVFCVPFCNECTHNSNFEISRDQRNRRKRIMLSADQPSSSFSIDIDSEAVDVMEEQPTITLLKELYTNQDGHYRGLVFEALRRKTLNPVLKKSVERDDLEFFIPQLITYLAFQHDLCDPELLEFLVKGCELHYVFSHYCYFYLKSNTKVNGIHIPEIQTFLQETFLPPMQVYYGHILTGLELSKADKSIRIDKKPPTLMEIEAQRQYGTIEQDEIQIEFVKNVDIKNFTEDGYMSTPKFWEELVRIGHDLSNCSPKIVGLRKELREINKKLPAAVYLPFLKLRNYVIMNINVETAKVFMTKERSPYSVCVQVFRQEEEYLRQELQGRKSLHKRMSKPFTISRNQNSLAHVIKTDSSLSLKQEDLRRSVLMTKNIIQQNKKQHILPGYRNIESRVEDQVLTRVTQQKDTMNASAQSSCPSMSEDQERNIYTQYQQVSEVSKAQSVKPIDKYFDIPFKDIENGIRSKSIYKHFKTWRLVSIMIKTNDNMKQQQFAMQLINQFNMIFQREETGLLLRPYEVISITPDAGIMEMVTDACSLGRIIKIMAYEGILTLKDFFKSHFKSKYKQAQKNFCKSLAAYSLVTYFLQVKDRHNDNILLHRDGYIVHIDFGFFLSNSPGQGIELQRKVPFKLISAYVNVLGGQNSVLFIQFRSLFQKGFRAAMKHKESIFMLVSMMYSSHGQSMPCFKKGERCIKEMKERFQPTAQDIGVHCQNLINLSLDNWRAKWYDKIQYWLQGVFY